MVRAVTKNASAPTSNEYLSVQDVARLLGVPVGAVRKWRVTGDGPRFAKLGKHLRTTPAELDRWVQSRMTASSGPLG